MSKLTRRKKKDVGASSVDVRIAALDRKRNKLLIDKQIQDLREKKKAL